MELFSDILTAKHFDATQGWFVVVVMGVLG